MGFLPHHPVLTRASTLLYLQCDVLVPRGEHMSNAGNLDTTDTSGTAGAQLQTTPSQQNNVFHPLGDFTVPPRTSNSTTAAANKNGSHVGMVDPASGDVVIATLGAPPSLPPLVPRRVCTSLFTAFGPTSRVHLPPYRL